MTLSDTLLQPTSQLGAGCRCPQCGGSGILRLADQRYRTCLDCLGQGQVVPAELRGQPAVLISVSASSVAR
jgi:DnaJ-class molecular chaperone